MTHPGYRNELEELRVKEFCPLIHPDHRAEDVRLTEAMLEGRNNGFVVENRSIRKDVRSSGSGREYP